MNECNRYCTKLYFVIVKNIYLSIVSHIRQPTGGFVWVNYKDISIWEEKYWFSIIFMAQISIDTLLTTAVLYPDIWVKTYHKKYIYTCWADCNRHHIAFLIRIFLNLPWLHTTENIYWVPQGWQYSPPIKEAEISGGTTTIHQLLYEVFMCMLMHISDRTNIINNATGNKAPLV